MVYISEIIFQLDRVTDYSRMNLIFLRSKGLPGFVDWQGSQAQLATSTPSHSYSITCNRRHREIQHLVRSGIAMVPVASPNISFVRSARISSKSPISGASEPSSAHAMSLRSLPTPSNLSALPERFPACLPTRIIMCGVPFSLQATWQRLILDTIDRT